MKIDADKWYSSRQAAAQLGVTEETIKRYCREGSLEAKQVGPRKRWHVHGRAILMKRKEWRLDEIAN